MTVTSIFCSHMHLEGFAWSIRGDISAILHEEARHKARALRVLRVMFWLG